MKKTKLETKREIAKIGMAGSTMFLKNKAARRLHIGAGIALIGFSLWHTSLYPKEKKSTKKLEKS